MKRYRIWRGVSAVLALFLAVLTGLTGAAFQNAGFVNIALGIDSGSTIGMDGDFLYKSDYTEDGKPSDAGLAALLQDEDAFCSEVVSSGSVLLKNDGALPLNDGERNVTLFGRASADPVYRCSAAGGSVESDRLVSYRQALEGAGFQINATLYDAYAASSTVRADDNIGEEPASFYSSSIQNSFGSYSDAAIVLLSRRGGEGIDISRSDSEGLNLLALHKAEKDMLDVIRTSGKFNKVIVLINSPYPMELGWLDEYGVNACIWIGTPGLNGFNGVPDLLTGKANPSGRLVDTYAANALSSPAMMNFGDYTFSGSEAKYVVETEGIYSGYKYYETRYEDCILGRFNANCSKGIYASGGEGWSYADEVVFPFGYGLSYTTFEQTLLPDSFQYNQDEDTFSVDVDVKNTGSLSGKSVVELYVQTPYTEYDQENLVEKSAVQLVGFQKTDELAPGDSQTVTITVARYLLASYDANQAEGYILDGGNYYFAVGTDAHDALNNILAKKFANEEILEHGDLVDPAGAVVSGNPDNCAVFEIGTPGEVDSDSYRLSPYTGAEVTNAFTGRYAIDVNEFYDSDVAQYLSRQDWDATYPETVSLAMNDQLKDALNAVTYKKSSSAASVSSITTGASNGIKFLDMVGVPFESEQWDLFLDQLSVEDMASVITDQGGAAAVESVSKPASKNVDGPDGVNQKYKYGAKGPATCYPAEVVVASSWDTDLLSRLGYYYAEDMIYTGCHQTWGPGANLHRTPFSGRNFEYYSEDGTFTYLISMPQIQTLVDKGVQVGIKHFCGNDQETNRKGIATFTTEQHFRQDCLRAFEGALAAGNAKGLMSAYNRVGCVNSACNPALLTTVLRDEWGFQGYAITDATGNENEDTPTVECVLAGTDMFCIGSRHKSMVAAINDNDDGDLLKALREVNHRHYYTMANSLLVNGLSDEASVSAETPWWQTALIGLIIAFAVFTVGAVVCFIISIRNRAYLANKRGKKSC